MIDLREEVLDRVCEVIWPTWGTMKRGLQRNRRRALSVGLKEGGVTEAIGLLAELQDIEAENPPDVLGGVGGQKIASFKGRVAMVLAALLLAACATTRTPEPRVVYQEVRIPVPTPCQPDAAVLAVPDFPDTHAALAAAPDVDRAVRLLGAGRALRDAYIAALRGALEACTTLPH